MGFLYLCAGIYVLHVFYEWGGATSLYAAVVLILWTVALIFRQREVNNATKISDRARAAVDRDKAACLTQKHALNQVEAVYLKQKYALDRDKAAFDKILHHVGITVQDLAPLSEGTNFIGQIPAHRKFRAERYLARMRENQQRRAELYTQKPAIVAAATIGHNTLLRDRMAEVRARIGNYRQECLSLQQEHGWPDPMFGTAPIACEITDIIDGDTIRVSIPLTGEHYKVRLVGFDCPETCHPTKSVGHWGLQATHMAERVLKQAKEIQIRLDAAQLMDGWLYDRYGRLTAHILADGRLLGEILLEEGCAEVLDVFPLEMDILNKYKVAEASAKASGAGMWEILNEIQERKRARYSRPTSTSVIEEVLSISSEDQRLRAAVQAELRMSLTDLVGANLTKSAKSIVVHNEGCRHIARISRPEPITISQEVLGNVRLCKVCGGDELAIEALDLNN